jgi:hypothetical protein
MIKSYIYFTVDLLVCYRAFNCEDQVVSSDKMSYMWVFVGSFQNILAEGLLIIQVVAVLIPGSWR